MLNVPVPVYGGVPPVAVTVTVEFPPLQEIGVAFAATVNCPGCVMVTDVVAVQLFASVMVKEYVPAVRTNVPVPVYGGVPPVAATVTVELPPLQRIGVALAVTLTDDPPATVTVVTAVQLFASVTVKLYVPAGRLNVPVPVYGGVPPTADTVTVESPVPQGIGVADDDAASCGGAVMVTDGDDEVHPFASVTVKV